MIVHNIVVHVLLYDMLYHAPLRGDEWIRRPLQSPILKVAQICHPAIMPSNTAIP